MKITLLVMAMVPCVLVAALAAHVLGALSTVSGG